MRISRIARATRVSARIDTLTFFRRGIGDTSRGITQIYIHIG